MYRGASLITIDAKGRIAIPARHRQALMESCGGQIVITADPRDNCLVLYPLPTWLSIEQSLANTPGKNKSARMLQRYLVGHACEVEMDRQGRMLLPQVLRDKAQLDKQAMLVGQITKFELWDEQLWNEQWSKSSLADLQDGDLDLPDGFENLAL